MSEFKVNAKVEELDNVNDFIDEKLSGLDVDLKIKTQIAIAVEEIFVNISNYSYEKSDGDVIIDVEVNEETLDLEISFIDEGIKFDPLNAENPDTTLTADERNIGGLGIFMVKKLVDEVSYRYQDNKNILTLKKSLKIE